MSIKKSFEDNKDEILKNLPEEFHADFLKEMENVQDTAAPLPDNEVQDLVAGALPDDLKDEAKKIDNEINAGLQSASKEEEKEEILKALPEELKAEFEKNWKG